MSDKPAAIVPEDFEMLGELNDKASHAVELIKAMANEWRLMILCQLAEGEKTVSELQAVLGLSQSALSQHLAVLRRERIVRANLARSNAPPGQTQVGEHQQPEQGRHRVFNAVGEAVGGPERLDKSGHHQHQGGVGK